MKKKLISLLMSVLMLLQCLTITIAAEDTAPAYTPYATGIFNGHTYMVFNNGVTWETAAAYCESLGGHLATVSSQEENDFLMSLCPSGAFMLGMHRDITGWNTWITGEPVTYTNWASGQPDNLGGTQTKCVLANYSDPYYGIYPHLWDDGHNYSNFGFICELEYSHDSEKISPSEVRKTEEQTITIQISDITTNEKIEGGVITLGGESNTTDSAGKAVLAAPESDTAALTITADGYTEISIEDYSAYKTGAFDAFELYPEGYTAIVPVSCNGKSIGTSSALINTEAPLTADIKVKGVSASEIEKFELVQGNTVLASSSDGSFRIANSSFRAKVPVTAKMYTADGKVTEKTLNIDVITFAFAPESLSFADGTLSVDIPEDIPLFGGITVEAEVMEMDMNLEISNDKIKVGYNQKIADKDLSKLNKGLRKWMDEHNRKTPYSNFSFNAAGYAWLTLGNQGLDKLEGEIILTASYKNGFSKTYPVVVVGITIPIRVEVEMGAKGTIHITKLGYDFENASLLLPETDVTFNGSLDASAGVGVSWASAGVYGNVGLEYKFGIHPSFLLKHIHGTGEIGLYAKVALEFWKQNKKIPILSNKEEPLILYQDKSVTTSSLYTLQEAAADLYNTDTYRLNSREYLSSMSAWDETVTNGDLQTATYDNADPQIVSAGGVTLMVFPSDNGGSDDYNFQQLVYSVRTDGGWSTPVPVDSNELVDADFTICTDGSEIWLAYTQANRLFTEEDDAEDCAAAMEIAVVSYDFETGTFTEPAVLTSNNTYDMNPEIAVIDGIVTVVWVNNTDNHLFGMTDSNTVYAMEYYRGWLTEEPVAVAENVPAVTSLAVGSYDGLDRMIAFVCDTDNDFTTTDDSTLMQFDTDGDAWNLLNEFTDVSYTGLTFHDGSLYMNNAGDILATNKNGLMTTVLIGTGVSADYQLLTRNDMLHIIYSAADPDSEEGGSKLYVNVQIDDMWETAEVILPLTDNEGYVDSFGVIETDGSLMTVYRRTDVTFTEDSFNTVSDLCVQYEPVVPKLHITGIQYDEEDLFGDTAVTLTISVTNSGLADAEGYTLTVGGNESLYFEENIASGATAEAVIEYTMLESDGAEVTVLLTDENGVPDTADVILGYADYSADAEAILIAGTPYASITIRNNGNMEGSAVVTATTGDADGETLYTESISLISGAQEHILLEILDNTIEKVYVTVTSDSSEYFDGNNHASCTILYTEEEKEEPVYGDINADGVCDAEDGELFTTYFAGYAAEIREDSADLDGDGTVTRRDAMILARHLAKWDGYALPYSE